MAAPLTFLFTDLENSTVLWQQAPEEMKTALAEHDRILRAAVEAHNGRIVKTTGDGIHAVFDSPRDAVLCALDGQRTLAGNHWPEETGPLKVRMGMHTGECQERDGDYYGTTVNQAARIMGLGHGGQILLSGVTAVLLNDRPPSGGSFLRLGAYQLKGLLQSEDIYQLVHPDLAPEFPPLKAGTASKHNLPSGLTPLLGRTAELEALSSMLLDHTHLLITIIAPGGMGKTRLALELGQRLVGDFKDGVFFVELAPIIEGELILPAISQSIGYQVQPGERDLMQQLADYLHDKEMLLILDNFEQVTDGTQYVDKLLRSCPQLKSLVTSRQRVGIMGESHFLLAGLDLPGRNSLDLPTSYPAFELFQDAARRARPDFSLNRDNLPHVVQICQLVQGMPLGILLAAQWVSMLSPAEILAELQQGLDLLEAEGSELPDRQRSIRVVFDYAWNMLNEIEQGVFSRMSVFRGGFSRQAGQAVAGAGLRQLQSLTGKALLTWEAERGRYTVHELVRQYAAERLRLSGREAEARAQHADYFLHELAVAASGLKGAAQLPTLDRIEIEFGNIRAAWLWAIENREPDLLGGAIEGMYLFCRLRSRLDDGRALFGKARDQFAPAAGQDPDPIWMKVCVRFSGTGSESKVQKARFEQALALAQRLGDEFETAFCLDSLGTIAHYVEQNPPLAINYYENCRTIYSRSGEKYYLAQVLSKMGEAYQLMGQNEQTLKYVNQAYEMQREIGDLVGESETLRALSMTASQMGLFEDFEAYQEQAYAIQLQTNYLLGQATSNLYLGGFKFLRGKIVEGRRQMELGLELAIDVADSSTQAWCHAMLALFNCLNGDFEQGKAELNKAKGIQTDPFRQTGAGNPFLELNINTADFILSLQDGNLLEAKKHLLQPLHLIIMTHSVVYMHIILPLAALVRVQEGRPGAAGELFGLTDTLPVQTTGWIAHCEWLKKTRRTVEEQLGGPALEAALERGKSLDLQNTVKAFLDEIEASLGLKS